MTELKPCPFCGGDSDGVVLLHRVRYDINCYFVSCERCYGRTGEQTTKELAIEAWNRRVDNG